jgi:uncharacterized small protein (DUF1192 family)
MAEGEALRLSYEREVQRLAKLVGDYEGQFGLVRVELERVNANLKGKVDEVHVLEDRLRAVALQNEELRRKVQESELSLASKQQHQHEVAQPLPSSQQTASPVRQDPPLRISELESKLILTTQEVERLNNVLALKMRELAGWREEAEAAKHKLQ